MSATLLQTRRNRRKYGRRGQFLNFLQSHLVNFGRRRLGGVNRVLGRLSGLGQGKRNGHAASDLQSPFGDFTMSRYKARGDRNENVDH